MRGRWGVRGWVAAASVAAIAGGTWWLLADGGGGVNVATVLALTVSVVALLMAVLDKLPGSALSRRTPLRALRCHS